MLHFKNIVKKVQEMNQNRDSDREKRAKFLELATSELIELSKILL